MKHTKRTTIGIDLGNKDKERGSCMRGPRSDAYLTVAYNSIEGMVIFFLLHQYEEVL